MKIGIGLLTYNREAYKDIFLKQLKENKPYFPYKLHIEENNPKIAAGKNNCLHALKNCEHIFLFDDDCFPILPRWDLPFIYSGAEHLLYLNKTYKLIQQGSVYSRYADCSGCFMFLTKKAFKKVGYFNTQYPYNGMEHVGYSSRIQKAFGENGFFSLNDTHNYIFSIDLQGAYSKYNVGHSSTISVHERESAIKYNSLILQQELNNPNLYYENNLPN